MLRSNHNPRIIHNPKYRHNPRIIHHSHHKPISRSNFISRNRELPLNARELVCPMKSKYNFSVHDCMYIKKKINEYFDIKNDISMILKNQLMQDVADRKYVEKYDFTKGERKDQLKLSLKITIEKNDHIPMEIKKNINMKTQKKDLAKGILLTSLFLHGGNKKKTTKTKNIMKDKKSKMIKQKGSGKLLDCAKYCAVIKLFLALQSLEIETGTL